MGLRPAGRRHHWAGRGRACRPPHQLPCVQGREQRRKGATWSAEASIIPQQHPLLLSDWMGNHGGERERRRERKGGGSGSVGIVSGRSRVGRHAQIPIQEARRHAPEEARRPVGNGRLHWVAGALPLISSIIWTQGLESEPQPHSRPVAAALSGRAPPASSRGAGAPWGGPPPPF
jgi:hypothetical protein